MSGQLPIDRVRAQDAKNQPAKDRNKERFAQKESKLAQDARTHDDDEAKRALESGESPTVDDEDNATDEKA